jgi:O-methyltransferase
MWPSLRPSALLRTLLAARGSLSVPLGRGWDGEFRTIRNARSDVPLLMSDARALQLLICVRATRSLDGVMAEAGVLMGGSARLICEHKGERPLHLFDVFETVQPSSQACVDPLEEQVRTHFGAMHGRLTSVKRLLGHYPDVHIHPGVFPQSVPRSLDEASFSFVHLDMDLPASTAAGIHFFFPRLVRGGVILFDDYDDPEVRRTFADAFPATAPVTAIELPWGQLMVVKLT